MHRQALKRCLSSSRHRGNSPWLLPAVTVGAVVRNATIKGEGAAPWVQIAAPLKKIAPVEIAQLQKIVMEI